MSGEFHEIFGSHFMWSVLNDSADTRGHTGEPLADALGQLYTALAPLERAVAWHQAHDSSQSAVVMAAVRNREAVETASQNLRAAISKYDNLASDLVRAHERNGGEANT